MSERNIDPALTILLPLKGRHLHTLRFLWHANRERFPYHFLVADGEVHPSIAAVMERANREFPNISIEYVRYPADVDFTHFYRKMADAVGRVRTPYVVQADNDDFLVGSGIERCIAFLESNPRFVSCSGGVGGFAIGGSGDVTDAAVGHISHYLTRYNDAYLPHNFDSPLSSERVLDRCGTSFSVYYDVYRTQALQTIHREVADIDFSDLHLYELYFGMRAKTLGLMRSDPTVMSYLRQFGSSMNGLGTSHEWVDRLVRGRFSSNVDEIVGRISRIVAEQDGIDEKMFADRLRRQIAELLHIQLSLRFRRHLGIRSPQHPVSIVKSVATTLGGESLLVAGRTFRNTIAAWLSANVPRLERQRLMDALAKWNASASDIATFSRELDAIEAVVAGEEFLEFVRGQAAELLPPEARTATGVTVNPSAAAREL